MTKPDARRAALCSLLMLSACSTEFPTLQVGPAGFQHPTYGYAIAPESGSRSVLPVGWQAHPSAALSREVPVDQDGDGVLDGSVEVPLFDLVYSDGGARGTIFVSTFPTSREVAASELERVLGSYVTSAARAGRVTYGFPRAVSSSAPPVASRLLGSRAREVDGRPAHELLFELADVPEAQVTDATVWTRGHVVLVRPELTFSDHQYSRAHGASTAAFFPVLMVLGYASSAAEFSARHDAFEGLLRRLRFTQEPAARELGAALRPCVQQETLVELLVLPEGRVGAHAALPDEPTERCVSGALVSARLPAAEWPRTFALRVTPATEVQ
ncbi:MAG: hypothetical protein KC593_23735 [Myxococcales bacterium]|nr:hypothetical protein [Myxococcales bacterium]